MKLGKNKSNGILSFALLVPVLFCFYCNGRDRAEIVGAKKVSPFAISGDKVRLRKTPSLQGEIIGLLAKGEELEIVDYDPKLRDSVPVENSMRLSGIWIKIRTSDAKEGYVFSPYIGYNMRKENSPSYIVVNPYGGTESFSVLGFANSGVLENSSEYSSGYSVQNVKLPSVLPKKDLTLYDSTGKEVGYLQNVQRQTNKEDCCFDVHVAGTFMEKSKELSKSKAVIGRTLGKYDTSQPVPFEKNIPDSLKKEIWKDSNIRIKKETKDLPKEFKSLVCKNDCFYLHFDSSDRKFEYIISEKTGGPDRHNRNEFPHVYRIDRIQDGKLQNLLFYTQFSYQGDTAHTFAVTDLDSDNKPEIWINWHGYEWWSYSILILDGNWPIFVYSGGGGGV